MIARWVLFPRYLLRSRPNAEASVRGLEKLEIATNEGVVPAWFLPADRRAEHKAAPLVIFAHGNGELIDDWPDALDSYRKLGLHVLLPEYRGYGRAAGNPSERTIVHDFVRFHDLAAHRTDVDPQRIVFHGRSLGGGVVSALARQRAPAAMVLESTFTSIAGVARKWHVPSVLIEDRFDSASILPTLDAPILLFHGTRDRVVPYEHGTTLARIAKRARLVTYECDHNDLPRRQDGYWSDIARFLAEAGITGAAAERA
ncbi:MAG: alpha/beta hydrolase [Polyangiaceae bacterium]